MGLWGMGQLSLTKMFVVVDDDVNVHDMNEVIWALTTRADAARDTTIINTHQLIHLILHHLLLI